VPVTAYIITALGAYLLGSIPFGFLAAKAKGIDIRSAGSGNIGATNAMRVLGKPVGIFVLVMDALKGFLACIYGVLVYQHFGSPPSIHVGTDIIADIIAACHQIFHHIENYGIIAGIFAVLGHNYPCWLKFKGGKGIATTGGVYLALSPLSVLIALIVFILAVLITRYVSVGSISAAVALPVSVWILPPHNLLLSIVTTALGFMAIYKHKSNIQRLMAGTENRLGAKPTHAGGAK